METSITLTEEGRNYFTWVVQFEYKKMLEEYVHVKEKNIRLSIEIQGIHRLNELCVFILGRNIDQQIRINKMARMIGKSIEFPKERYPLYDFDSLDFSEERLNHEVKKMINYPTN